jgi:hypothetical protein
MRLVRSLVLAVSAALCLAPAAHATCGAEGCPFVRDSFGAGRGRYSFDLRFQGVTQDELWNGNSSTTIDEILAGSETHGEVELYTKSQTWMAEGSTYLTPSLRLIAVLPYIHREHQHMIAHTSFYDPRFVDSWDFEGLGDMSVVGQYRVLNRAGGPSLELQAGIKLPTGRTHVPDETKVNFGIESTLEPSIRPGTGSTDWITGAFFTQPLPWHGAIPLTASVLAKWTGKGTDDYEVGDEVQAGVSGGYTPMSWITLLGQVNFSAHGADVSHEEGEVAHSAMQALYLTPGVSVRVAPAMILYGIYQARVWGHTDEATVIGNSHFLIGTTYTLGH